MGDLETVKIKHPSRGYAIINKSDYDPNTHKLYDDESKAAVGEDNLTDEERSELDRLMSKRKIEANRGISGGPQISAEDSQRNPSGTYSEPTPTDIRYPDKLATEFENNMGAFIGKSAAGLREEAGLPDAPGGIKPQIDIPADWADQHWKQQVGLAEQISGESDLNAARAREIISAEVERRKA